MLEQLNESRQEAGLAPLKVSPELLQAARQHSWTMARQHKLSHQLPGEPELQERLGVTGAHFFRSGENVGFNTQADLIHDAFMHSPPHRQNLLTPEYNSVGIGIVQKGDEYWVTEDFAQTVAALSVDQASVACGERVRGIAATRTADTAGTGTDTATAHGSLRDGQVWRDEQSIASATARSALHDCLYERTA